ncbi:hypothetical protein ACO1O0_005072 [Amphichorda felina]
MTHQDIFDDVLNVESRFQEQGYNEGLKDGAQHGLAEGRAFGMQKAFEKFLESGRLAGKSVVWANRLPGNSDKQPSDAGVPGDSQTRSLGPLPNNARLEKNINTLYSLVDPKALSTENSDAAVQDFDDRLKKAQGKERIIERVVTGSAKDGPKAGGAGSSL